MAVEWRRKGEMRRHFKEKMSLEEAYHRKRPWIRAWKKKEMNEGRGGEEPEKGLRSLSSNTEDSLVLSILLMWHLEQGKCEGLGS